jgi:hypothetical protein
MVAALGGLVFLLVAGVLLVWVGSARRMLSIGDVAGRPAGFQPGISPAAGPAMVPASAGPGAPGAALISTRRPLQADGRGRVPIPLADPMPARLPAEGVPPSWVLKEFTGRASVELARTEIGPALRLRSEATSFALYRDLVMDLGEFPILTWSWKVVRLPSGGDVRQAATDDQAIQLYVVFPRWPSPRTSSDVIGYVWDTSAPVGTRVSSAKAPNVRIIVLDSGGAGLGTWRQQARDVVKDYGELFGRQPPRVGSLAVMVDTNDTSGTAESWITDLAFSRS